MVYSSKYLEHYLTLPSLSLGIFRAHYLRNNSIPITSGKVLDFIRKSYTGGMTNMYKPSSTSKIYCYDVNSLYPTVMRNNLFPVGNINYFEGDISILGPRENNILFVSDCKVTSKKDLYQPYLQIHHKISSGYRTFSPSNGWGNFSMEINSPEYYNAIRL